MCKKKQAALAASPMPKSRSPTTSSSFPSSSNSTSNGVVNARKPSPSSSSSHLSITSIKEFISESPHQYNFTEIQAIINNPETTPLSPNSYRCVVNGQPAAVIRRRFHGDPSRLRRQAASAAAARHVNLARLLGAAVSADVVLLVYEFVPGAALRVCLRNPKNPNFTPISTWVGRIQVAHDVAQGLQYIHHFSGADRVHDQIRSSAIMISDPDRRAKLCHFAAADLAPTEGKFEGTRGYIAPEVRNGETASQKSDVFAFGVVLLELITGEEPVKYTYNSEIRGYEIASLVDSARILLNEDRSVRSWVDRRLKDSFPEEVVKKVIALAVDCVQPVAERRPGMVRAAAKISALLIQSKAWADMVGTPGDSTLSLAPR